MAGYVAKGDDFVRDADGNRVVFTDHPVLDEPTWRAVRDRRGEQPGGVRVETLLHGIARCASCGGRMRGSGGSGHRTYTCPRGSDGTGGCDAPAIVARHHLDEFVVEYTLARLSLEALAAADDVEDVEEERRRGSQAEVDRLAAQLDRLEEDLSRGPTTMRRSCWRHQHGDVSERLAVARRELEDFEADVAEREVQPVTRAEWDALPIDEQREILSLLIDAVVVQKAGQGRASALDRLTVVPRT